MKVSAHLHRVGLFNIRLDELEKSALAEHSIETRRHTDTSVSAGYVDRFVKALIGILLKMGNF